MVRSGVSKWGVGKASVHLVQRWAGRSTRVWLAEELAGGTQAEATGWGWRGVESWGFKAPRASVETVFLGAV